MTTLEKVAETVEAMKVQLSVQNTALREVQEETGLEGRPLDPVECLLDLDAHLIPAREREPAHRHFDLRVLLEAEGEPIVGDGVSACRWVTPAAFGDLDLDPGLQRALGKIPWRAR